jgi:hypothetical protein
MVRSFPTQFAGSSFPPSEGHEPPTSHPSIPSNHLALSFCTLKQAIAKCSLCVKPFHSIESRSHQPELSLNTQIEPLAKILTFIYVFFTVYSCTSRPCLVFIHLAPNIALPTFTNRSELGHLPNSIISPKHPQRARVSCFCIAKNNKRFRHEEVQAAFAT